MKPTPGDRWLTAPDGPSDTPSTCSTIRVHARWKADIRKQVGPSRNVLYTAADNDDLQDDKYGPRQIRIEHRTYALTLNAILASVEARHNDSALLIIFITGLEKNSLPYHIQRIHMARRTTRPHLPDAASSGQSRTPVKTPHNCALGHTLLSSHMKGATIRASHLYTRTSSAPASAGSIPGCAAPRTPRKARSPALLASQAFRCSGTQCSSFSPAQGASRLVQTRPMSLSVTKV